MGAPSKGMLTPNSRVTRSARLSANGGSLASFLTMLALDSPAVPVRILFENEGASCWTMNTGKTLMVFINRYPIDGLKVKEPCAIVCNPKEVADLVRSKSRGETIRLTTEASEPIKISTKERGGAEIMPADEDDCMTIPDRNVMPSKDGKLLFPMFENEPATSEALIDKSVLTTARMEMATANAPYVVMTLDSKSEVRAGHWTAKTTRSWTPIEAEVKGESFTVAFTDSIQSILSLLTASNDLKVSKHSKGQFVALETLTEPKITIIATEAIKEI